MAEKTVLLTQTDGVATITLNRPAALNALDRQLVDDLTETLQTVQEDPAARVVVLTGAGKGFCAGGDLFYILSLPSPTAARDFVVRAGNTVALLMAMPKPVIAMVNGVAAGAGFNLALACDIIFCAQSARFGQSFAKVGLVPDCGGMYLLPRVVGLHKAKELMFTGDLIDAATAQDLGVVNRVVPDADLKQVTYDFARRLAQGAPIALGLMKRALNRSVNMDLADVLELEADLQSLCTQTQDHKEGVAAFKEKRAPVFTGQ